MTDLLTHAEYKAIAKAMNPACNAFIDGKFQAARSRKTFASVNPATGKVIAKIAACDAKDVNFTVKKARETFDDGRWRKLHQYTELKTIWIDLSDRNAGEAVA